MLFGKGRHPIGSQTDIPVDVRVVATTNRNMSRDPPGNFREDLYYRLNGRPAEHHHARVRIDDVVPVATFLLQRHVGSPGDIPWLDQGDRRFANTPGREMSGNLKMFEAPLVRLRTA